jgi:hypothetical protein
MVTHYCFIFLFLGGILLNLVVLVLLVGQYFCGFHSVKGNVNRDFLYKSLSLKFENCLWYVLLLLIILIAFVDS